MHGTNYSRLSFSDREYFNTILSYIESYKTEFAFSGVSYEYITKIYSAVLNDNPQIFWLSGGSRGKWTEQNGRVVSLTFYAKMRDGMSISSVPTMKQRVSTVVSAIVQRAMTKTSKYAQVLYVHDYLVDTTDYVLNAPNCYDVYGCLINHRAVCAGYAAAFQLIMSELGFECGRVSGYKSDDYYKRGPHEWNYIKMPDGYFYFMDVTWDDPVVDRTGGLDNKTHNYFCLSGKELSLTHRLSSDQFIPSCMGNSYNYYIYYGMYAGTYSFSAVENIALKQLLSIGRFSVKFASKYETERAVNDLIKNQRIYSIRGVSNSITYSVSHSGLILTVNNR